MVPMGAAVVVHNKRPARIAGTLGTTGATARWPSNHFCSKSKMAKCLHELVRGCLYELMRMHPAKHLVRHLARLTWWRP